MAILIAPDNHVPKEDAEALYKACKVLANVAIRKSGDFHVIVEIACVLSPEELLAVKRACKARYKHSLEEDLAAHTTGDIRKLLVGLVTAFRYEGDEINARLANSEADTLHDAIKDYKGFNHEEVIRILTTRSKTQLTATFNRYRDDHGSSITKALLDEPAEEFKTVLRTANSMHQQPQKILRNAIRKFGTDEDALTRVIVTRAEKDLNDIKEL
ncbi:annexin-like protein RJ4 [Populus trichocarpa]|uniref:annexin-like protein RJ4 n=1 Tax=Populus trichocarpa TaxID=3694 RepID=UPI002279865A|nr:annexin-like protein RJ4 [Populus trichocarpa]